ncbi:uncharacterized protein A4U43_C07F8470 [Asparagus officinalis]|uniref:glutathione transferase n=1 Tax=Asparagus officinalis TaxID=4686 RepID=A0A5P1EFH2_ASPOF|nr:probable glutathione S-transferase [Asparagus officinalis]ONK62820.1 uncharacterized protein A4U43_C07F8470 [Asparagus officinalis]
MAKEVKLVRYRTSPFSLREELALELKGVPYDCLDLEDVPDKNAVFLEYNPIYKKIPVLVHKGKYVAESLIILEYIEDTWGAYPLLPKDPYERACVRHLANFIDDKCIPTFRKAFWGDGDMQKTSMEQSKEYLSILQKELKNKKFFGGNYIGFLDIAAAYIALWVGVLQEVAGVNLFNREDHPILWKWSQEFLNSKVAKKILPEREKLVAFFNGRKEIMKDSIKTVI